MEALAYYNPEKRMLISGDALWENGFGVIFPELLGEADGLAATRATLEMLARLPLDTVIPGHGRPSSPTSMSPLSALSAASDYFSANIDKLAWNAIKVLVSFAMMERQSLPAATFDDFVRSLPFAVDLNARYLGLPEDQLGERILRELLLVNALRLQGDLLVAGYYARFGKACSTRRTQ